MGKFIGINVSENFKLVCIYVVILLIGVATAFLVLFHHYHAETSSSVYEKLYVAISASEDASNLYENHVEKGYITTHEANEILDVVNWKKEVFRKAKN